MVKHDEGVETVGPPIISYDFDGEDEACLVCCRFVDNKIIIDEVIHGKKAELRYEKEKNKKNGF